MSTIEELSNRFGPSYKWFVTVTVMLGTIATTATATIVNVGMPYIAGQFSMGADEVQWLSSAFLAAMTASMLLINWIAPSFGERMAYVGAIVLFVAASLLGAASPDKMIVILARTLQGAASGIIQPLAMAMIFKVFPRNQRGLAMGIYGVGVVLAPAMGPTAGGYFVDTYNWRYLFLIVIPFCLLALPGSFIFLPNAKAEKKISFDGLGFLLITVFLFASLGALSNGQRQGWDSSLVDGLFVIAFMALLTFIMLELRLKHPILELRVFQSRTFTTACLVAFALGAGIYGSTYLVPLFVEGIQEYNPTSAGLVLMPSGLVLGIVFPLAGALSDRVRPHWPIIVGLSFFAYSSWLFSGIDVNTWFWTTAFWAALGRFGLGFILPSMNAGALKELPMELVTAGSGVINFIRQAGGAFGVNLLTVLVDRRSMFHSSHLAQTQTPGNYADLEMIRQMGIILNQWGNPFGDHIPGGLPPGVLPQLSRTLIPKAQMFAYQDGFMVLALVFLLAIIPAWMMGNARGR
jgi:EmrB/QacA subfamily drug resistance transporter